MFKWKKYYVNFIDDFPRYCQVQLLHGKNETPEKFRIFKNESKLHCQTFVKRLKSDRHTEYYDPIFFNLLV